MKKAHHRGKKAIGHKGTKQVGRQVGMERARHELTQHDRAIEKRGSMGYGKGIKPPKSSVGKTTKSGLAKKLEKAEL